jgi:hypothetical protein
MIFFIFECIIHILCLNLNAQQLRLRLLHVHGALYFASAYYNNDESRSWVFPRINKNNSRLYSRIKVLKLPYYTAYSTLQYFSCTCIIAVLYTYTRRSRGTYGLRCIMLCAVCTVYRSGTRSTARQRKKLLDSQVLHCALCCIAPVVQAQVHTAASGLCY